MSKKKKTGKNKFTLELKFDVDQVTMALNYKFYTENGSIFQEGGRCAGCFHFGDGGKLDIIVIGTASESDDFSYNIKDLTITSLPTMSAGTNDLSPFDVERACVSVKKWAPYDLKNDEESTITTRARKPLTVCAPNGQWSLSGLLSVVVEKCDAKGKKIKQARLFYFDPEGTTGSGGGDFN